VAKAFAAAGKPVAAVSHALWLLIDARLVSGRKVTSWHSLRTDLKNAGGPVVDESAVIDRGIITSRKPEDLHDFVVRSSTQTHHRRCFVVPVPRANASGAHGGAKTNGAYCCNAPFETCNEQCFR
jgi:hypothetical protein